MRTRIALAGVAVMTALLVTAGIAGAFSASGPASQAQLQQQGEMSDTITVSGNGQVQAQADRAVVRVAVLATGDDIGVVREQLSSNASQMREALSEIGIEEGQVRTGYFDISSQDRHRARGEGEPKYRGIHSFTIAVENLDSVGQVIDTAVSNGASEVDGVQFTLSKEKREDLRQKALEAAMDNARTEASTIAGAEDLSITGVDRVRSSQYRRTPYRAETAALGGANSVGTSIDSGPVTVSASVTVVYDTDS